MKNEIDNYLRHVNAIAKKVHTNIKYLSAFTQDDIYHYGVIGFLELLNKSKETGKPINWKHFHLRVHGSIIDSLSKAGVHHRNEVRLNKPMKFVMFNPNVHDRTCDTEELNASMNDDIKELLNAIQKLNARQQIVIGLRHFNNKTFNVISADLNYSLPTIHRIYDAGIDNLRKMLLNETNY